jgi:hypothetical protein
LPDPSVGFLGCGGFEAERSIEPGALLTKSRDFLSASAPFAAGSDLFEQL